LEPVLSNGTKMIGLRSTPPVDVVDIRRFDRMHLHGTSLSALTELLKFDVVSIPDMRVAVDGAEELTPPATATVKDILRRATQLAIVPKPGLVGFEKPFLRIEMGH